MSVCIYACTHQSPHMTACMTRLPPELWRQVLSLQRHGIASSTAVKRCILSLALLACVVVHRFVVAFAVLSLSVALLHYTAFHCNLLKHTGKPSTTLLWRSTSRASCVYGAFCTLLHVNVCYWALLHEGAFHSRACHERRRVLVCLIMIHCQLQSTCSARNKGFA